MTIQTVVALAYDKRGRLIAIGKNSYKKTHPIQYKYAHEINKGQIYLHAEMDALIKARFHVHKMVINRIGKSGKFLASQPCSTCLCALMDAGVEELEFIEPDDKNYTYWHYANDDVLYKAKDKWGNLAVPIKLYANNGERHVA